MYHNACMRASPLLCSFHIKSQFPFLVNQSILSVQCVQMSKKTKGKASKADKALADILIDDFVDDKNEDLDDERDFMSQKNTPLSEFLSKHKPNKKEKGAIRVLKYQELLKIVQGDALWRDLDKCVIDLKTFYTQHLTLRSGTSVEQLPVELEGDTFCLGEVASVSKRDPKRIIIDSSDFPQAAANIMKTLREAGMNLNPQQDGLKIYVPIPKVTKEYREKLVVGAKKKLNETKDELKKTKTKYEKLAEDASLNGGVSQDDARSANETIKVISENFLLEADNLYRIKAKELLS